MRPRHAVILGFALVAFAMNSILCRLALAAGAIDAVLFTLVRLAAGAGCLALILAFRRRSLRTVRADLPAAAMLFLYAIAFSLAYRDLAAGTGALVLFGMVQVTMIGWGLTHGERLRAAGWAGLVVALSGLVVLTMPGLTAPSLRGGAMMAVAGIAWGVYSLRGRALTDPLAATAGNFSAAVLPAVAVALAFGGERQATPWGIILAVLSGAVASALGYVAWYAALQRLRATGAATVQLLVPVIAAVGGVLLLGETVTVRLLAAAGMILGGVHLTLRRQGRGGPTGRPY
jgi:drug/metabolite transporter (DMT)-like permease